jgi:hypothetical protein
MKTIRARSTIRPLVWSGAPDTRPPCSVRQCPNRARYVIETRVVQNGREGRREEFRCITHGRTFSERRGLELPPVK